MPVNSKKTTTGTSANAFGGFGIWRVSKTSGFNDLRHFATTMLFIEYVLDAIIREMTGHRSEELERYKHLSPEFSPKKTRN